jgi:hypothetical protein
MSVEAAKAVQEAAAQPEIVFVTYEMSDEDVLRYDGEGKRIVFEHEVGVFKRLSEETLGKLSHSTKVGYSVSHALNAKHDPENDEMQQRIKMVAMRNARSEFESRVRSTSQGMNATKKLQAYVGHGFEEKWSRPDKIEQRLAMGYEIVDARRDDVYAGVTATKSVSDEKTSHFEVRSKPGEAELVLMRIPSELKKKVIADRHAATARQTEAMTSVGKREIVQQGGKPVDGRDDLNWTDRK